tara:strand:- start:106 stop:297 length:192 start_codon:yes stop_codon:yes gene_type:complete
MTKYKNVEKLDSVEYLRDASDKTNIKKVIKKIIFLCFLYLKLFFGTTSKKQLKIAIIGINNGL